MSNGELSILAYSVISLETASVSICSSSTNCLIDQLPKLKVAATEAKLCSDENKKIFSKIDIKSAVSLRTVDYMAELCDPGFLPEKLSNEYNEIKKKGKSQQLAMAQGNSAASTSLPGTSSSLTSSDEKKSSSGSSFVVSTSYLIIVTLVLSSMI